MLIRKSLARFNLPLTLASQTVFLPIRKHVVANAEEQIEAGIQFELKPEYIDQLDSILNYSLATEYRAPTPSQVRLVAVITRELGLEPNEHALTKKEAAGAFINKYRVMFDRAMAEGKTVET